MKDFTYYNSSKASLQFSDSKWLNDMGLKETRWILDREWFLNHNEPITFKKWICE